MRTAIPRPASYVYENICIHGYRYVVVVTQAWPGYFSVSHKHNPDAEGLTAKIIKITLCVTYLETSSPFCSSTPRHVRHSRNPRSGSEFRQYASIKEDNSDCLCVACIEFCVLQYIKLRAAFQFRLPTPHSVFFRASERAHFVARNSDFSKFCIRHQPKKSRRLMCPYIMVVLNIRVHSYIPTSSTERWRIMLQ